MDDISIARVYALTTIACFNRQAAVAPRSRITHTSNG
jgi:hypothetical protein